MAARRRLSRLLFAALCTLVHPAPTIYSVPTVDENSGTQSEEHTVERSYKLHRAWDVGAGRERMYRHGGPLQLEPCNIDEAMLTTSCFVNEGSTSVHVPRVKGYQFGCADFHQFACGSGLLNMDKVGYNQRCVACARRWGGSCSVRTVWDLSCG